MVRIAPKFNRTEVAKGRVDGAIKLANDVANDLDRDSRILRQRCNPHHYFHGLAGQELASQPCACCGKNQRYASTDTDVLCMECAQVHGLCKHCGGDSEMRTTRRDWPAEAEG